jgi:ADP-ribose pyrophosphatase YjhB (NUDIX family)
VLELGESILDGLQREIREETGLLIAPERLTGVYKNMPRGIVALVFRARIADGTPQATEEASRVEWWTRQMVTERLDEAYAIRVLDALDHVVPAVRAHDGVNIIDDLPTLPR